jgi:large subunit ribosomal protein L5
MTTKREPSRIRVRYQQAIPELEKNFGYANAFAVPRLVKVVVNAGVGKALKDPKYIDAVIEGIGRITGQRPVKRQARSSISGFKIRKGMIVGVMVTLRGRRMEEFIDRLVSFTLPRVRDFQGIDPKGFGKSGSYTLGVKEHTVFPETLGDEAERAFGIEITIVATAKTPAEGLALLRALGFPFQR